MKSLHVFISGGVEWTTIVVGVATGVIVSVATVLVAQALENRRWNSQQVSIANAATADRLRVIYGRMAQAAVSLRNVRNQRNFTFNEGSVDERDIRNMKDVRDAINHVAEVGGQIIIESSGQLVAKAYSDVASSIDLYLVGERDLPEGIERAEKLSELANQINTRTDDLIKFAVQHLEQLGSPASVGVFSRKGKPSARAREHSNEQDS